MQTYKVTIHVKADNTKQLREKLQAFQDLQDNMEHEDLISAVDVIVENPEIVDFIKEVAPGEGQELHLGDYVNIARKAFERFG